MYKVFVVEDELLIRQNIRNMVENLQEPYFFCGEACDGEMALSIIQEVQPDILLTDIRMPFLDGLGLIEQAKALMPWLKVAVISGYGDFSYAQKAIALGVNHYLLKPVRQAELTEALKEMGAKIDAERALRERAIRAEEDNLHAALRRQWLAELLYEKTDLTDLSQRGKALHLDVDKGYYLVAVVTFDSYADPYQLKTMVQNTMETIGCDLYLFNTADQISLMTANGDASILNERMYQWLSILNHEIQDACTVMTVVIGRPVQHLEKVGMAAWEANHRMRLVRNLSAGKILNLSDSDGGLSDLLAIESPFGSTFQKKLQEASEDAIPALVDEALQAPGNNQYNSMLLRYQTLLSVARTAACLMTGHQSSPAEEAALEQLRKAFNLQAAAESIQGFRKTIIGMLQMGLREQAKRMNTENNYHYVIHRAEKYAQENFSDPNISLLTTARHVGMSSAYFSTVFSQSTGTSFIAYITTLRVERAKQLLVNTKMRLADIAMEIGYNEPNYFSHVFRKATGMTPKEYRQRNG